MTAARSLLDLAVDGAVMCSHCSKLVPVAEAQAHVYRHLCQETAEDERDLGPILYRAPFCSIKGGCPLRATWQGERESPCQSCANACGPKTESAMQSALARFSQSFNSVPCNGYEGGLWDEEQDPHREVVMVQAPETGAARDRADVLHWLGEFSATVPASELECAVLYWRQGLGTERIAEAMNVSRSTVRKWLVRTRQRVNNARLTGIGHEPA